MLVIGRIINDDQLDMVGGIEQYVKWLSADFKKCLLTLFAARNCSPVTAVTQVNSISSALSDRDLNGKNGGS